MFFDTEQERAEYIRQVDKNKQGSFCFRLREAKRQLMTGEPVGDLGCCASCLMSDVDVQSFRDGTCYCWYSHEMTVLNHSCEKYLYKFDKDEMERA